MKSLRTKTTKSKNAPRRRTLPRVARAPKGEKQAVAAPSTPGAPEPAQLQQGEASTAFVSFNGTVNPKAPLMTLVTAMFEAPNAPTAFKDPSAEFLSSVLLSIADDAEILEAASREDTLDRTDTIGRCSLRAEWRARIAVEIARRLQTGAVTP